MDSNITLETVLQDNGFKVDSYEDPILAQVLPKIPLRHQGFCSYQAQSLNVSTSLFQSCLSQFLTIAEYYLVEEYVKKDGK